MLDTLKVTDLTIGAPSKDKAAITFCLAFDFSAAFQ